MKVSVIIPTYNRAQLISESINSVLNQTYRDFEIIVVDDASEDGTVETVKSFGNKVKLIQQDHQGPNVARNRALAEAKGEYIALLDDDDLWLDFKLELQVAIMNKFPKIGFLFSDFFISKDSGEKINAGLRTWHENPRQWEEVYEKCIDYSSLNLPFVFSKKNFHIYTGNLYYALLLDPYVLPSSSLVRSNCITEEIKFIDEDFHCGDWDFFARLSRLYPAGFMELETTINRSHQDDVRLTRKSRRVQTECRIGLINRVWKSDKNFHEKYHKEVNDVEGKQIIDLIKYQLFDSDLQSAKENIRKLKKLELKDSRRIIFFLNMFIYFPGGDRILIFIRNLRRVLLLLKKSRAVN